VIENLIINKFDKRRELNIDINNAQPVTAPTPNCRILRCKSWSF